jgi:hypothetical protein
MIEQYYRHYTELPDGYRGLEMSGTKQFERASSLLASKKEQYFLETRQGSKFVFWLPASEEETTGKWVKTGKGKKA